MKLRTRIRAGVTTLAVAAAGLTFATAGPATVAHACGLSQLGPTRYIWGGSHTVGTFYLAWNSCKYTAYTEAHITNTNWTRSHGFINVYNSSGVSWAPGPSSPTVVSDGTSWWDSGFLSIYSNPSSDRVYRGYIEFTNGDGSFRCSGYTPEWNFSTGSVYQNDKGSDMYC
ncbi:hypothetical protein [Streptomyces sp. NPDC007205]|uniref:hypothetical protein n=1 Tax=Streptomyces sp. NPDC007205 TaxID=3154316 RepID=UPI00340B58C1